jgi:hypothetical protein
MTGQDAAKPSESVSMPTKRDYGYPICKVWLATYPDDFVHPDGKRGLLHYAVCTECNVVGVTWQTKAEAQRDADKHNAEEHAVLIVPPVQCRPWCEDQDGHPDMTDREDQFCATQTLRVENLAHDHTHDHVVTTPTGPVSVFPDCKPDAVCVYAKQDPDSAEPTIVVGLEDEPALEFTPNEARELCDLVQLILGQIGCAR